MSIKHFHAVIAIFFVVILVVCPVQKVLARETLRTDEQRECLEKPDSGCLYKYLAEMALRKNPGSQTAARIKQFYQIAESLIAAQEFDLAKSFVLRGLAETDEIFRYPNQHYTSGLVLLSQIEKAQGNAEFANRLFSVSHGSANQYTKPENLDEDSKNEFIKQVLIKKNFYAKKLSDPSHVEIGSSRVGRHVLALLKVMEELATSYLEAGRYQEALEQVEQLERDHIVRLISEGQMPSADHDIYKKSYRERHAASPLTGIEKLNLDKPDEIINLLKATTGEVFASNITAFLDVLFEIALKKYQQGNKAYASKATKLAEAILIKEYDDFSWWPNKKFYLFQADSHRDQYMAMFYAVNGDDAKLNHILNTIPAYRNDAAIQNIVKAYAVRKEFDQAIRMAAKAQGSPTIVKSYGLLLKYLYESDETAKWDKVSDVLLERMRQCPVSTGRYVRSQAVKSGGMMETMRSFVKRLAGKTAATTQECPADQVAEAQKEIAKYAYLMGKRKKAQRLVKDAMAKSEYKSFMCTSDSYCPVFHPRNELLGLLMKYEKPAAVEGYLNNGNDYINISRIATENGEIDFAIKTLAKAKNLYAQELSKVRGKYIAEAKKRPELKRNLEETIARREETLSKSNNKSYTDAAVKLAFHIALSKDKTKYKENYEQLALFLQKAVNNEDGLPSYGYSNVYVPLQIAEHLMNGKHLDVALLTLPLHINAGSHVYDGLINIAHLLDEANLKNHKQQIWDIYQQFLGQGYDRNYSHVAKKFALELIKGEELDAAERIVMDTIDFTRLALKTGYKINFVQRGDRVILRLISKLAGEHRYEKAKQLIPYISSETMKQDSWYQITKYLLQEDKKSEAAKLANENINFLDDRSLLVQRLFSLVHWHHRNDYEQIYETVDYLNDRIFVLGELSRPEAKARYTAFVKQIGVLFRHPEQKAKISLKAIQLSESTGGNVINREDYKKMVEDFGTNLNFNQLPALKDVALKQMEAGYKDDALETLEMALGVTNRFIDQDFLAILPIAEGYAKLTGPIDEETKKQIKREVRTRPNVVAYKNRQRVHKSGLSQECAITPPLSGQYQVHMVSIEEGTEQTLLKSYRTAVRITASEKPIVLVLAATSDNVWSLELEKNAKIAAVFLGGATAKLEGLPDNIPVMNVSGAKSGKYPKCNKYITFMGEDPDKPSRRLLGVNRGIRELTGRDIDHIYLKPSDTGVFIVKELSDQELNQKAQYADKVIDDSNGKDYDKAGLKVVADIVSSDISQDISFDIPPNEKGLIMLRKQGRIRNFTSADQPLLQNWVDGVNAQFKRFNEDIKLEKAPRIDYVVIGRMMFPPDMGGAHSRSFLVPENVPAPAGYESHNRVYYLSDFSCKGGGSSYCR